uniref:Uncharacterized protein n=1 Tax=viral metagenome TaxID=1070528 RepID=A0A6C0AT54_9ZZZZ
MAQEEAPPDAQQLAEAPDAEQPAPKPAAERDEPDAKTSTTAPGVKVPVCAPSDETNGAFAARMVAAVVITLLLSSLAFSVGSAWNNAMQDLAKRKRVPLWVYATLMTLTAVALVIVLAFAARAAGADKVVGNISAIAQMKPPSKNKTGNGAAS